MAEKDERQYSQEQLEEIVSRRIKEAATEQLVTVVKSTVNGLKVEVDAMGKDIRSLAETVANLGRRRRESAQEMVRELGVVTLTEQDRKVFDVMLEDYRDKIQRKRWWQGRTGAAVAILGAVYLILQVGLLAYTAFFGTAHPLRPG